MQTINNRIVTTLKKRYGTITLLAKNLNISRPSVCERIYGDRDIDSIKFINAVCRITGCQVSALAPELNIVHSKVSISIDGLRPPVPSRAIIEKYLCHHKINKKDLAAACGLSFSGLRDKINNPKGIDSIKFILALSALTNIPGIFFYNLFKEDRNYYKKPMNLKSQKVRAIGVSSY